MILSSFSYTEPGWSLAKLYPLSMTTLLVGRNATGKTRTISALYNVVSFIRAQKRFLSSHSFKAGLSFSDINDSTWSLTYSFEVDDNKIVSECLLENKKQIVKRDELSAICYNDVITPPADKLIIQVRRDVTLYPVIERLMAWVEGVTSVACSDITPLGSSNPLLYPYDTLPFSELVKTLTPQDKQWVLDKAKEVGYNLLSIEVINPSINFDFVIVKERGLQKQIIDVQISNGMFRVLYILCFMKYVQNQKSNSLILVDDLGEGLDYSRSTHLGKLLCDFCEECGVQAILTSNDAFLMDVIDISNWQVLQRKNSKVSSLSQTSHPDLFKAFRMTGLSNFDLFSSDFIANYLKEHER